jgi:flagellar M-ring protein FliF
MDDTAGTPAPKPLLGLDSSYWFKIIEAAIMCVTALLIGLFVAKPLINRMFAAQALAGGGAVAIANVSPVAGALPAPPQPAAAAEGAAQPAALPAPGPAIDISRIDGQVSNSSIKKVGEVVSAHPEEALAIIRTWLHQPV